MKGSVVNCGCFILNWRSLKITLYSYAKVVKEWFFFSFVLSKRWTGGGVGGGLHYIFKLGLFLYIFFRISDLNLKVYLSVQIHVLSPIITPPVYSQLLELLTPILYPTPGIYVSEIYIYYASRAVLFLYLNDLFFSLSRENNIKGFSVFIGVFS